MEIEVRWVPAQQGSLKHIGKGRLIHTNKTEINDWRNAVMNRVEAYRERIPEHGLPYTGAVWMRLVVSVARPPSVSRRKRPYPSVAPDLDKLMRSVGDALTKCGVVSDDALIVEFTRLAKVYCNEDPESLEVPGARIVVLPMAPLEELTKG
jgi:Holliday junction resolvase RusA-like endonuclease